MCRLLTASATVIFITTTAAAAASASASAAYASAAAAASRPQEELSCWATLFAVREVFSKTMEVARADKTLGSSLEAAVALHVQNPAVAAWLAGEGGGRQAGKGKVGACLI